MNKAFLAFASMIITGFILKSYRKLKEKPATKKEVYRAMKAERERIRAQGARMMAKLDASLRPSKDMGDAMALAPARFS